MVKLVAIDVPFRAPDMGLMIKGEKSMANVLFYTARNIAICTGLQPPINTGQPTGIAWPVLNDMSFSTGQVAQY